MRSLRKRGGWLALLAALALVAAACSSDDTADTTATTAPGATTTTTSGDGGGGGGGGGGASGRVGEFKTGLIADLTSDNYWAILDTQSQSQNQIVFTNMKPALFTLSLPGFVLAAENALGQPVEAVQEGDVWTVTQPLRTDRVWSDGTPVTANDMEFTFDTVREFQLGSNWSSNFPPQIVDVEAVDDFTVKITFSDAPGLAVWQNGIGLASWQPKHFWEDAVADARAEGEAARDALSADDARQAIYDNDVAAAAEAGTDPTYASPADVTDDEIQAFLDSTFASTALNTLYGLSGAGEPSAGAVIFEDWEPGAFASSVANDNYYYDGAVYTTYADSSFRQTGEGFDEVYGGSGEGDVTVEYTDGPFVERAIYSEYGEQSAAYQALKDGEIDFVFNPVSLGQGLRNELAQDPNLSFAVNPTEGFRYMAFNLRKAPMNDLAFRQALSTIIDKEFITSNVLAGAAIPTYTMVDPNQTFWFNENHARPGVSLCEAEPDADCGELRFNEAIGILKDAGYTWDVEPAYNPGAGKGEGAEGLRGPDGALIPELELLAPGPGYDPLRATFSQWIATFADGLGIRINARPTDFNAIIANVFPPQTPESILEWDLYILGWGGGDPSLPATSSVAFFHSREDAVTGGGFNTPGYASDEFDAAADAFEAATDLETAQELTFQIEEILTRDMPYVWLFRAPIIEAYRSSLEFPVDDIYGGLQSFPNGFPGAVKVISVQ